MIRGRSGVQAVVFACLHLSLCVLGGQTDWTCSLCRSSQYTMVAGAGRENGMETPMHENPEWEKARQALASISKAGAAGSSAKASSNGPVAGAQVSRPHRPGHPAWGATWGGTHVVDTVL